MCDIDISSVIGQQSKRQSLYDEVVGLLCYVVTSRAGDTTVGILALVVTWCSAKAFEAISRIARIVTRASEDKGVFMVVFLLFDVPESSLVLWKVQ